MPQKKKTDEDSFFAKSFNLDRLKSFYTVARYGSVNKAARKLNISQPALSRQISSLEESLQTLLFYRYQRGLKPTKQGEILLEHAERILTDATEAQRNLTIDMVEPKGPLKISTTVALSTMWLPEKVGEFVDKHLEIEVTMVGSNEFPNLAVGEADVVIWPSVPEDTRKMVCHHLTSFRHKLFASPEYIKKFGMPKGPEDLKNHRLLAFGAKYHEISYDLDWLLKIGAPKGKPHKAHIRLDNRRGLFILAAKGYGITMIDENILNDEERRQLVPILPDLDGPKASLYFIYPRELEHSKRVQTFYEVLKNSLG